MLKCFKLFTRTGRICFEIPVWETKREEQLIDEKDNMIDNFLLQPNFKYYQNHDFHKLVKGLKGNKTSSLLHTNIKTRDIKILGWCPAGSVLPHGEKVPL